MAKKAPQRRKQSQNRETNWVVIGGLIAVGILVLGGLLYLALRPSEATAVQTLAEYCQDNSDRCIAMGQADAPITMIEVSDFGCIHCQAFHAETATPLKTEYVDTGSVRWVVLPYALSSTTLPATASAMCANEQDKFFDYSNALFAIEPAEFRISADGYRQAAETVGLDIEQFTSCLSDTRYNSTISSNQEAARRVGVSGTPTFFVNDTEVNGAQPFSSFSQIFNSLLPEQ